MKPDAGWQQEGGKTAEDKGKKTETKPRLGEKNAAQLGERKGGGYTAHGAVDPPGGYLGGPGVRKHVPIKRQQGDDHSGERYGPE